MGGNRSAFIRLWTIPPVIFIIQRQYCSINITVTGCQKQPATTCERRNAPAIKPTCAPSSSSFPKHGQLPNAEQQLRHSQHSIAAMWSSRYTKRPPNKPEIGCALASGRTAGGLHMTRMWRGRLRTTRRERDQRNIRHDQFEQLLNPQCSTHDSSPENVRKHQLFQVRGGGAGGPAAGADRQALSQ